MVAWWYGVALYLWAFVLFLFSTRCSSADSLAYCTSTFLSLQLISSKLQNHPDHPLRLSREMCQGYSQEIERELGPCSQFVIRQIKQVPPSIVEAPSSYSYRLDHQVSWY
jgi:hypothetical protein